MEADAAFNLSALADRLRREGRYHALAGKIQAAVDMVSIEVDLMLALDTCDAIDFSIQTAVGETEQMRRAIESALLAHVVVLYSRATKTTSKARKSYDPRSKFTAEELMVHQELCDLRDMAVAHFGKGGSYSGNWTLEYAVLEFNGARAQTSVISRRLSLDQYLADRARKQIVRTLKIVEEISRARINDMTEALDAAKIDDPEFEAEVTKHPINLTVFVGGEDEASRMKAGEPGRKVRGSFGRG